MNQVAIKPELLITDSFKRWLLGSVRNWISLLSVLSVSTVFTFVKWATPYANSPWLTTFLLIAQLLVIAVLLFLIPDPVEDPRHSPRATIAIRQFHQAWRWLWIFWFLEYIGLSINESLHTAASIGLDVSWFTSPLSVALRDTLLDLLNNLPTIALIVCYVIATERTVQQAHGKYRARTLPWDRLGVILLFLTLVELIIRMNDSVGHWFPMPSNLPKMFNWVSGVAAGTATALVVGRLDSKFINLPLWVIAPLYFYGVIQTGWEPLQQNPPTRAVLLNLALALKCLFFAAVQWLFTSGVFLFYMERVGLLFDDLTPERRKFLVRVQRNIGIAAEDSDSLSTNESSA